MITRSKSSEIDSDVAVRKGANIESELSSWRSGCIRSGGQRYLDGSDAKVKEVESRTLLIKARQIDAGQWFDRATLGTEGARGQSPLIRDGESIQSPISFPR